MKSACHHAVAQVIAWSLKCSSAGVFPSAGCFGEALVGQRAMVSGSVLAKGWRAAYFGCKYDAKARKETNEFPRSYLHNLICESCFAQKKNTRGGTACSHTRTFTLMHHIV